ncbi:hypothetical protein [Asanoa siamensis]|uniref:Uncharacterized protein n=1 Tax=Asanoa siamensis TaxID=926357 RepID=A0ABQ4CNX6_9ACTN|nr:hypothetical protein [Asanoa siamensis]GIF72993.1 hypothetical protein Asi02nite_25110 [Asanoa siamensis]
MTIGPIDDLGDADLLERRQLVALRARGDVGTTPVGGVRCGRPLVYPIAADDLPPPLRLRAEVSGEQHVGVLFAFDLERLPDGDRYVSARFEVALTEPEAMAVRVDADADTLGVTYEATPATAVATRTIAAAERRPGWLRRLAGRERAPRAWVAGVQTSRFAWVHEDPRGDLLLPRHYGMHAVLALPAGARQVAGTIGVQVEVAARRGRVTSAREHVAFAEPCGLGAPAPAPADAAAVRLCMAADVVGYSRRRNAATERIQADIVALLGRARRAAGIADGAVRPQPQGDGQFTVLPVGIDESAVIPRLLAELDRGLRALNAHADDRMRIRVALHRGLVKEGANGWIGNAPIAVHRILDSPPLRAALHAHPRADFVLGVPDVLYRDVFVHAEERPRCDEFTAMTVELPEKGFVEHAWLYVG